MKNVYVLTKGKHVLSVRKSIGLSVEDAEDVPGFEIHTADWVGEDLLDESCLIYLGETELGDIVQASHDSESLDKDLTLIEFTY